MLEKTLSFSRGGQGKWVGYAADMWERKVVMGNLPFNYMEI